MTVTVASFRSAFPEFTDPLRFTDAAITQWTGIALQFLNARRFGTSIDYATMLYVAHRLSLAARNFFAAQKGGVPGQAAGVASAKSVNGVSVSYDTAAGTNQGAAQWNLTTYGIELFQLAMLFGAGGIQISEPIGEIGEPTGIMDRDFIGQ